METIKSCTDIKQSRKLAEFLSIESADMWYHGFFTPTRMCKIEYNPPTPYHSVTPQWDCPCWSLAALFNILPLEIETHKQTDGYKIYYYVESYMKRMGKEIYLSTERHENLVDACYELILKLKEKNLL